MSELAPCTDIGEGEGQILTSPGNSSSRNILITA